MSNDELLYVFTQIDECDWACVWEQIIFDEVYK